MKFNNKWGRPYTPPPPYDPLNPLNLPARTIRVRFAAGTDVNAYSNETIYINATKTLVDAENNIWDITYPEYEIIQTLSSALQPAEYHDYQLLEVLGANTHGITDMHWMFCGCRAITYLPIFDTSAVTNMSLFASTCDSLVTVPLYDTSSATNLNAMFAGCSSIESVPLYDTSSATTMERMFYLCTSLKSLQQFNMSNVTNMDSMCLHCSSLESIPQLSIPKVTDMDYAFKNCYKVSSGALALYQQASTKSISVTSHSQTFTDCGRDTTAGAAELAQIPSSWGGNGA